MSEKTRDVRLEDYPARTHDKVRYVLDQGERLAATAETVIVLMDEESRRSTPLPPATVDALEKLMAAR